MNCASPAGNSTYTMQAPLERRRQSRKPVLQPLRIPGGIQQLSRNDPPSPPANPPPSPRQRPSLEFSHSFSWSLEDADSLQKIWESKNELVSPRSANGLGRSRNLALVLTLCNGTAPAIPSRSHWIPKLRKKNLAAASGSVACA
jgi:hypothetical protein